MSERVKPQRPSRAPFDSQFEKEESRVRSRASQSGEHGSVRAPVSSRTEVAPATPETMGERTARIEQKVARATLLLQRLSPIDGRARLLGSAVLRRDEVLLDAVLGQMTDELLALSSDRRRR